MSKTHRTIPPLKPKYIERFWARVKKGKPDECWEWTASKNPKGYGWFRPGSKGCPFHAHRIAWRIANGPVPVGLCVLHRCDNPPCCNPHHLFLGTQLDNVRDKVQKGRAGHRGRTGLRKDTAWESEAEDWLDNDYGEICEVVAKALEPWRLPIECIADFPTSGGRSDARKAVRLARRLLGISEGGT